MVEGFSLLAVGTSLIGTILGFSQFFEEQLNKLSFHSSTAQSQEVMSDGTKRRLFGLGKWWESNKINFAATAMVIAPPILVSTTVPDAFSAATDIAGGYCMTILYGVLPPAMAWAMKFAKSRDENCSEDDQNVLLSTTKPVLLGVGLFACAIVMEQMLQDLSVIHL